MAAEHTAQWLTPVGVNPILLPFSLFFSEALGFVLLRSCLSLRVVPHPLLSDVLRHNASTFNTREHFCRQTGITRDVEKSIIIIVHCISYSVMDLLGNKTYGNHLATYLFDFPLCQI